MTEGGKAPGGQYLGRPHLQLMSLRVWTPSLPVCPCLHMQFIMGDLNYRLTATNPETILRHIQESAIHERAQQVEAGWLTRHYERLHAIGGGGGGVNTGSSPTGFTSPPTVQAGTRSVQRVGEVEDRQGEQGKRGDEEEGHSRSEVVIDMAVKAPLKKRWSGLINWWSRSWSIEGHGSGSGCSSSGGIYSSTEEEEEEDGETVQKQSSRAGAWSWVGGVDELMREMGKGEVFGGFQEGPVAFPPSFRWKAQARAQDFDQVCGMPSHRPAV